MSNPFGEPDDDNCSEILEGFLCPICHVDLKSLEFLTEHFERFHAEEQDALKSIFKDIFSKARKKIKFNFDDSFDMAKSLEKNVIISGPVARKITHSVLSERLEVGVERSHFEFFQSVRNPRLERYASETNKLIIRLHKLLKDMPADQVLRKQHEQNTVTWLDGSSVKLCPSCAKSFHIARRQHHCRLCGSIMCNDCSKFLPLDVAMQLASLTMSRTEPLQQPQTNYLSAQHNGIRSCDHCVWLLDTRKDMHESRTCRPLVSQIYMEVQKLRKDVVPDLEMYSKIIASLYEGESIFTIADASALRGKIGQVAEAIDLRSKHILSLPCETGSRDELLKKSIRLSCVQLIKEKMLSIPPLPVEEEVRKIQERKRMETEQRIETERRQALEAFERYGLGDTYPTIHTVNSGLETYAQGSDLRSLDNWTAHQVSASGKALHDDPLVEQINIIKGYIKQARQDMNFEVVETLEINLRELQREFYERQSATTSATKQNKIEFSET